MHNRHLSHATLAERLAAVIARIRAAEARYARPPGSVQLLAVSKTFPAPLLRTLAELGQQRFGENYLQEALPKIAELENCQFEWHFIGAIQSNKTAAIASHFAWVHSVDRLKIAERLSAQRPGNMAPLQICLQVNVSGEASKSGCDIKELAALADAASRLPGMQLRGIMALPAATSDDAAQRLAFSQVRQAFESLQRDGHRLDTLSMGTSSDLEAAIAEGATLVRIGSALFGERE
jgi:pyridoxal phosphate enzyme (YggS family)